MTQEEHRENRANLLEEMATLLNINLEARENQYDANEIYAKLREMNRYSEDAIEDFVTTLHSNGNLTSYNPFEHDILLGWEEAARADEEALTRWEESQTQSSPPPPNNHPKVENNSFSIESILGNTYPHVADILYTEYIPENQSETFGNYTSNISTNCENITSLVDNIDAILLSTNSNVFYKGREASKNIKNIKTASSNAATMKTNISSETEEKVWNTIKTYNTALKAAKQNVRIELLQKKIEEINGEVVDQTSEKWTVGHMEKTGIISVTKIDGVYDVTLKREYLGESGGGWFSKKEYSYLETVIKTIAIPLQKDYQTMETNILKVKKTLPYDKSKIVE